MVGNDGANVSDCVSNDYVSSFASTYEVPKLHYLSANKTQNHSLRSKSLCLDLK